MPKTHDYGERGWGHDYTWDPREGGLAGHATGWGCGIQEGDYLLLKSHSPDSRDGRTRYQVKSISYYLDPPDMWSAELQFAPR